jgi:glycosyltransferase involved in cell wall biosynthesis
MTSSENSLRAVIVHNRYRSAQPSGENSVVEADIAALEAEGVEVYPYIRDSDEIDEFTLLGKAGVAVRPIASPADSLAFRRLLRDVQPHVVHLHNPYPLISPWIVRTAKAMRVPVVQTVHNFRHVCANGLLFRDGQQCSECVDKPFPWPAIQHGCYRNSHVQSVPMAVSLSVHRGTWQLVDHFLPVGEGVADHLRQIGLPEHKITVRPNSVPDPGAPHPPGEGAMFVGRLTEEKGIELLLDGWRESGVGADHILTIVGDGQLRALVERAASQDPSIRYLGYVSQQRVDCLMREAALIVSSSVCAEADPLAVVAATAAGRAVLATNTGAVARYIDSSCGWLCAPDVPSFAAGFREAFADRSRLETCGLGARSRFEQRRLGTGRPSLASLYATLSSVPRGVIAVVGPDGAGKSTIVETLVDRCQRAGVDVSRVHFRPAVLGSAGAASSATAEDPHAQVARPLPAALLRSAFVWLDFLLGWLGPWRRSAARGLLLAERPWMDQVVDPIRYRLPQSMVAAVRAAGRILPRADITVVLAGDAGAVAARKPEIGEIETRRQQAAWQVVAGDVGGKVVTVDAVGLDLDETLAQVLAAARPPEDPPLTSDWRSPLGFPSRLDLRVTSVPMPAAALAIYRPQRAGARVRAKVGTALLRTGVSRAADPPLDLHGISSAIGFRRSPICAMRSGSNSDRWILGFERAGVLAAVAKCGRLDDASLRNEAAVLDALPTLELPVCVPEVLFRGEVGTCFVLVTKAVRLPLEERRADVAEISRIAHALTENRRGSGAICHGDLAPWNLMSDGTTTYVLDWESARYSRAPLWDLSHFVIQQAALVRAYSPDQAIEMLCGPGSVGVEHLRQLGEDESDARSFVRAYLRESVPLGKPSAEAVRQRIALLLG